MRLISSRCTMPMSCCAGSRASRTFAPTASAETRSRNSSTTSYATSASRSAVRTSPRPSRIFDSESFPLPRRELIAEVSELERLSNMTKSITTKQLKNEWMMKNPAQIQLDKTPDSARYDDGPLESGANTHCVAIPDAWPARAVHRRIELKSTWH